MSIVEHSPLRESADRSGVIGIFPEGTRSRDGLLHAGNGGRRG